MGSTQKCVICGEELNINMTQLVLVTKGCGVEAACCSHEGSQELKSYIEANGGAITFDEYFKNLKNKER